MATTPPTPPQKLSVVSAHFLRPAVLGCLVLAGSLVPKRAELVKRLWQDGHHERALAVAEDLPTPGSPQITILKALPLPEETVLPAVPEPSALEKLRAALVLEEGLRSVPLSQLIQQTNDPQACWDLVHELEASLDDRQRAIVYLGIGQAALGSGNPGLAADIFADGAAKGVHEEALLVRQVTAYRWSGRPALALAALEAWQREDPLPVGLRDLPFQLYREMNRPDQALQFLLTKLQPESATSDELKLACEVANQAGQITKVLPLMEAYLQRQPAGRATVQELAEHQVTADASWQNFTKQCAQYLEWGGRPLEAFRLYQKLAVLGDQVALERLLDLNPGLNLDGELLPVLQAVVPLPARPALTLTLAQMEADAGEYEAADRHFAQWLEKNPRDLVALKQRAAVAEEQSRLEDACAIYEQVLALAPQDLAAQKTLADLRIARREFRAAFQIYEQLPEKAHDNFTLENYALLAESLAEYPAYNRALVARMHRLKQPTTQDFLELGRSYAVIGGQAEAVKTYETGLRRIPQSHILRIELAHVLRLIERYSEALMVLGRPEMKGDMQAMQLYIELACLAEDYVSALSFLGRGIEKKFAFGPEVRLDLGQIYLQNGYATEADALLSSVPDEPALWPLLAAARFKAGNFPSAANYQLKYLSALKVPDPQGWMLMGDIYKAEGREQEAQRAYAKSLAMMEDKLPDNEEPEPPPPSPKAALR